MYEVFWKSAAGAAISVAGWVGAHEGCLALTAGLGAFARRQSSRAGLAVVEQGRERRMREELEAYLTLDLSLHEEANGEGETSDAVRVLARRVCRTIAGKSVFSRVSLLLRNPEDHLELAGSIGTDDLTVAALQNWGREVSRDEGSGRRLGPQGTDGAAPSFNIPLGEWSRFDPEIASWALSGRKERRRWRRGIITPVRSRGGRLLGALAVCADGARVDGTPLANTGEAWNSKRPASLERALAPLEALASRLGAALEANTMSERLLRAEKLAGVGQLAAGVAHALNNPLTAVLGFADLIAETASEPHIRKDAGIVLAEASRMQATVQRLVDMSQPARLPNRTLDLSSLLVEVADACENSLAERGILLEREGLTLPATSVLGCRDRLREVLEQLLNNAAQAIALYRQRSADKSEEHTVRIACVHDGRVVRVLVSDTGTGFAEPGRAFDPFYTTRGPEQGAGLGLSICYGIVREHRGEIHALNREPHGATVAMEFPVRQAAENESVLLVEEKVMAVLERVDEVRQGSKGDKIRGMDTRDEMEEELAAGSAPWRLRDRRSGSR